ncbi:MAG: outer membrane beta-barrel protein [Candidatus Eisenbacteria bacterium]|uniref:Outer membrane beta-barrel protein n=1 Tax=Eiseniibacteriota bacterium TaxID=2212470 RepID=A0A937X698_UNCEI|nr:outer membrane beta-barrel protein [Candidatus Eisenbacteria bacterium]
MSTSRDWRIRATDRPGLRRPLLLFLWLFLLASAALVAVPAAADAPRLSAALGYGVAGLFHDEYVAHVRHSSAAGEFSAGVWSVDAGYLFGPSLMVGARVHGLCVEVGDGAPVGKLDILPATAFLAYRRPALAGRLGGFFGAGVGRASVRFVPADTIAAWLPWQGGEIGVSSTSPFAAELFAGAEARLSENWALELRAATTWVDCEVAYRPRPIDGEGGFAPAHAYRVQARHLSLAVALRWWVEWW